MPHYLTEAPGCTARHTVLAVGDRPTIFAAMMRGGPRFAMIFSHGYVVGDTIGQLRADEFDDTWQRARDRLDNRDDPERLCREGRKKFKEEKPLYSGFDNTRGMDVRAYSDGTKVYSDGTHVYGNGATETK